MEFKNWASYRIIELLEKNNRFFPYHVQDYIKSKSYRLSEYIIGFGKYSYRNQPPK